PLFRSPVSAHWPTQCHWFWPANPPPCRSCLNRPMHYRKSATSGKMNPAAPKQQPPRRFIMLKVSEILRVKGDTLFTASPDAPISQALATMSEHDIGSLVIMAHGELVGMLPFRELILYMHSNGGKVGSNTIRSIMDDAPVSVSPNTSAHEVQRLMLENHARYIPVMDGPTLMGVISFFDMARALVAAQQFEN